MKPFVLAVLCLLIVEMSYAQSQDPPPGRDLKGKPIQQSVTASKKPATEEQRGTEKVPFVIKSIPAEQTPQRAEESKKEREAKAANEWGLTFYTGLLAIFTFCLVAVGGVQVGLFVWQLRLIRDSLRDAKDAADAAKISAVAAENSVKLARDEFIATYRPRLIIRRINIRHITTQDNYVIGIDYEIANIGSTSAKVIEISTSLWMPNTSNRLPQVPPYGSGGTSPYMVESGSPHRGTHFIHDADEIEKCEMRLGYAEESIQAINVTPAPDVYFFGYIVYLDQRNMRFETAFLREYNYFTKRFTPVDEPDYEYMA